MSEFRLPLPVATLLRRARNAKSPRDRHDTAYHAWEVAIRLAVAARPPADCSSLVRPTAGHWVTAMGVAAGAPTTDAAVRALHVHVTLAVTDRRVAPQSVEPHAVLDALVAYRNKVIGHGAATRPADFYSAGATLLMDGLAALWSVGVFLPRDAKLLFVEGVEEDEQRRRRARLFDLRAEGPEILDAAGTADVPDAVVKGHVVLRTDAGWTDLFPWVLYRTESEQTLFYNSSTRQPEYLDFASGAVVRGAAVEEVAPGVGATLGERLRGAVKASAPHVEPARGRGAGDARHPLIGRVIQGQYRIDRELDTANVYEAHDLLLERRVAVKALVVAGGAVAPPAADHGAEPLEASAADAFLREVRALSQSSHPNVVKILAAGRDGDVAWYAMELVVGRTVGDLVRERGPLPVDEACDLILQACHGLGAIHARGVLHRSVLPENLVVAPGGTLVVTGLGFVHGADARPQAIEDLHAATDFIAPEQLEERREDVRTDIYSLGAVFFFLLTGRGPHTGRTDGETALSIMVGEADLTAQRLPELPERILPVLKGMLARWNTDRYASCDEVIHAVEAYRRSASTHEDDPRRFGDFELLGKLGEGGMGIVYLARQQSLDRIVALKMLPPGASDDVVATGRFRREMTALSRCDHPNVVKILASGDERGRLWYAMEYVEGADLAAVAGELSTSSGLDEAVSSASGKLREKHKDTFAQLPSLPRAPVPLSARRGDKVRELAEAMRDAAHGLEHLHAAGIIHRDVKPGNLMLTPERRVVVMDLGLAAMQNASRSLTRDKAAILGTLRYMPPEQLQRSLLDVDERSDVYALGATFYELLAGRALFECENEAALIRQVLYDEPQSARRVNPALPDDLATIVGKCIAKDPRERYRGARAVADDVQAYLDGRPIAARPPSFGYYLALAVRRNKPLAAAVVSIFVVLAAGFLVTLGLLDKASRATTAAERETARAESATKDAVAAAARETVARTTAETATRETAAALLRARAIGFVSASQSATVLHPMRALLLAREATRLDLSKVGVDQLRVAVLGSHERVMLRGHRDGVSGVAFSPDGTFLLTASRDSTARLWNLAGSELAVLRGHEKQVTRAVFSPNGTRILTASYDQTARVWDLTGQELAVLKGHVDRVASAAFSPDGSRVVTASDDGTARIWDLMGRELSVLRGHEGLVRTAVFSPDGTHVLTASDDMTARLWDLTGRELLALRCDAEVDSAAFSRDGNRVLTVSYDAAVRVWDLAGKELAVLRGHQSVVTSAVFSPDGALILTASRDKTARLWDVTGKELAVLRGHEERVTNAALSADGTRILTASWDKTARLWDRSGRELSILRGHEERVWGAAFSPDGTCIGTASDDKTARLWDVTGKELSVLTGHQSGVLSARFSPDGRRIATASADRSARLWNLAGRELSVLRRHDGAVSTVVFSTDGTRILTTCGDRMAHLSDASGKEVSVLRGHENQVWSAAFSPDGTRALTASWDHTARLWDQIGTELAVLRGHKGGVRNASFSPDGSRVLTASEDRTARLWDLTGNELLALQGSDGTVWSADFSPDSRRMVTASSDKTARLWDLAGKGLSVLRGHEDEVYSAVFSPDGTRLLTASGDKTARLWDLTGKELAVLRGHDGAVRSAVFSPDGTRILTASDDGTARIWLVRTEDLLALADSRITRDFTDEERRIYADLLGDAATCGAAAESTPK